MDPMFPDNGTSDDWDNWTPGCWMHKIPTWYGPDFFPDVRAGGPGTETTVPSYQVYNNAFLLGRVGTATALAVVLTLVVFVATVLINRVGERGQR